MALTANEGETFLTLKGSKPFAAASAGFIGVSDGLTDLKDGKLDALYASTGADRGAIMLTGQLPATRGEVTVDYAIGFGPTAAASAQAADGSLKTGYDEVLAGYNSGWESYLASLVELPRLREASMDGGKLLQASALMLKVQEDRTHSGALIASLSNPWGDTVDASKPSTGYKAVWPRDFYQCAMALAALGDIQTPLAAFHYLPTVQVGPNTPGNTGAGGWFLQKAEVDGTPEWVGVQLDQTAMPIMLGWKLWKQGWLSDDALKTFYGKMIKPAADFLVDGGKVGLGWNSATIVPPFTQQERWEEQGGHSPSTTAAVIAGLVTAGEIADLAGADQVQPGAGVETRMVGRVEGGEVHRYPAYQGGGVVVKIPEGLVAEAAKIAIRVADCDGGEAGAAALGSIAMPSPEATRWQTASKLCTCMRSRRGLPAASAACCC
ncbi:MAG: hypothetical protein B7Y78_12140, partial [Caulobacter sp. 35-67-4]